MQWLMAVGKSAPLTKLWVRNGNFKLWPGNGISLVGARGRGPRLRNGSLPPSVHRELLLQKLDAEVLGLAGLVTSGSLIEDRI